MSKIHFLNVGHGDCTIIEHNDGKITMIDINNGDEIDADSAAEIGDDDHDIGLTNPVEYFKTKFPGKAIFRYIQSHPDFDHMRGLAAIESEGIKVWNFWDTDHSRT